MAKARILIVQDDFLAAERLRILMEEAGYTVSGLAGRTDEALDLSRRHRPHLAIVDMMLEVDVDGIATARELAAQQDLKIMITTGFPESVVEKEGVDDFACGVVKKPYSDDEILDAVAACLGQTPKP